jgi:glycosyltransferase involved in cell wall biosynthesis
MESILSQTYPYIECILVDNASTDNSEQVIQEIRSAHPEIIFIQRCSNDGQSAASIDGFRSSSGQYVVFVDADDWLLPEFVRTHVFVHLSARIHVGLTSSDMFQAYGDRPGHERLFS